MHEDLEKPNSILQAFISQALLQPHKVAIQMDDLIVTYAELLKDAQSIAAILNQSDCVCDRVGLMVQDPPRAIACMLGIAMANAAWIYLDPSYPLIRLNEIIANAKPDLILTYSKDNLQILNFKFEKVIELPLLITGKESTYCHDVELDVAYILYTSGSTGTPKGVFQNHRNLWQHILCYIRNIGIKPNDRVSLLAPLGVDAALMDIFGALCAGASLHIRILQLYGIENLSKWIDLNKITIYHSTPTIFRALVTELSSNFKFSSVSRVVLGGEPATHKDLVAFQKHFDREAIFINGFGPSECTVATQAFYNSDTIVSQGALSIGTPVDGVNILLLDEHGRRSTTKGEIVILSNAIVLGYWGLPEETSKSFLNANSSYGTRAYFTGDIGEYIPGKGLVHIGRKDSQLKIRGHRIEAEEVEAALREVCQARQAALVKTHNTVGDDILVGVIEKKDKENFSPDTAIASLKELLPSFSVPTRILLWDAVPLTPSGKIDRLRLSEQLKNSLLDLTPEHGSEPRGKIEIWLAQQWSLLLGIHSISRESDFFWLGGHSLLATKLLARIRNKFNVHLSPSSIFRTPKLYQIATLIDTNLSSGENYDPDESSKPQPAKGKFLHSLSRQQEQLWLSAQFSKDEPMYQIVHALKLNGDLNPETLRRSLQYVINRNESLNSHVIISETGDLTREYSSKIWFEFLDDSTLNEEVNIDATYVQKHVHEMQINYRTTHTPPINVRLIRITDNNYILILITDHVSLDGISVRLFLKQWNEVYNKMLESLTTLPSYSAKRQYSDYITWQKQWENTETYREHSQWWVENLKDARPLGLYNYAQVRKKTSFIANQYVFKLGKNIASRVRLFNREHSVTMYTICLCAYALLLARYFGTNDVCIATPVANRVPSEFDEVLGLFVNTVIMRLQFNENLTISEMIELAHKVVVSALDKQQFPFLEIVKLLGKHRESHVKPFLEAMLVVQNLDQISFESRNLHSSIIDIPSRTVVSDLCLTIFEEDEEVLCKLEYSDNLFKTEYIRRMASHFVSLLASLVREPEATLSSLQMLSSEEQSLLARGIERIDKPYDLNQHITVLFDENAKLMQSEIAVICGNTQLTYKQIYNASLRLANRIWLNGIRGGTLVPLLVSRDEKLPIALLAILKSGNAFVPIDLTWPSARIEAALKQCQTKLAIIDSSMKIPKYLTGFKCLSVTDEDLNVSFDEIPQFHSLIGPEDTIYGIFTSGSTSLPKLALVKHAGINNRFSWMTEEFASDTPPVTLVTTPHVYDSSVWQLLWPLTNGGKVVIPSNSLLVSGEELLRLTNEHKVTIVDFVPSVFDLLVQQLEDMRECPLLLKSLKFLVLGGESVRPDAIARFLKIMPNIKLINLYGPTETTIGCIFCIMNDLEPPYPIGRAIPNVQVMILDEYQRLLPQGSIGQIYLGGICVGKGYWNNMKATLENFIVNPYTHFGSSEIIYKTGDLGRVDTNGQIYFLGRIDDQIKHRGVRIDPTEIENIIYSYKDISTVAVDICNDTNGNTKLCAWIQPKVPIGLREHCNDQLPISHIPEVFIDMENLPLTANGKIDRKVLRSMIAPSPILHQDIGEFHLTKEQRIIADVWREVLKLSHLPSINQNFFDLGGNSLLAIQVLEILKKRYQLNITIVDIFRYPTIALFVERLS
ncbi:MAG: hypothetical protein BGO76_00255 [Caedibacter sp. 38-128]|nr:amino acid adenylation domain-containing protein [Holosporales bacterium]OJX05017.1 MAG: hypothetical protein BGO76_00255 [Caedibacter sp. 38-128]